MNLSFSKQRPALRVLEGGLDEAVKWSWFCGHCAAPAPEGAPPVPSARVCRSCGLGLLLEAREDVIPTSKDAFLVIDSGLLVHAMSRRAQSLLGVDEELAVNKSVTELLVPADAEAQSRTSFAAAITQAVEGDGKDAAYRVVRPWNTFGVRMRARISACGPPRAALLVLENAGARVLHAVQDH